MKLIRFGNKGQEKPGVLINGTRRDCSGRFSDWNRDFFNNDGLQELQKLVDTEGEKLDLVPDELRWGSCIARPGMILCVGLNYSDHAKESGMPIPEEPILFMKASNTIAGPYDPVTLPKNSKKTDWEVELGIVMGKNASYLEDQAQAFEHIAGFCIVHDISEREFQLEKGGQWVKGKSCPGFSPTGPYLVTKDEVSNINDLAMHLSVNGKTRQKGTSNTMIFGVKHIVHYVSQFMLLEAGDLISTGTPPGVGGGMNPPVFLKDGDVVELGIENLGQQKQAVYSYRKP